VRATVALLVAAVALGASAGAASGRGASFRFDGGTAAERQQVVAALDASSFDWTLVAPRVTIHIADGVETQAGPGEVWLDSALLDGGRFAWGLIQHELAHEVDFLLLDAAARQTLASALGASAWCYEVPGLRHAQYGCERFASTLAWAYWPSKDNCLRPMKATDEAGSIPPAQFRALLAGLLSR
jgi:hypothetical protein